MLVGGVAMVAGENWVGGRDERAEKSHEGRALRWVVEFRWERSRQKRRIQRFYSICYILTIILI